MSKLLQSILIKCTLFLFIIYGIYLLIKNQNESLFDVLEIIKRSFFSKNYWKIILIISLTPLNWAFEALKWQFIASKIEKITFLNAYKAVLAGLSLGFSTPLSIGDFAAKIFMLQTEKRKDAIGAILMGNGMQFFVTLVFGVFSYWYFIFNIHSNIFHGLIATMISILVLIGFIIMLKGLNDNQFFKIIPTKIHVYLKIIEQFSSLELFKIFQISSIRFIIIVFQFSLAFEAFQINIPIFDIINGVVLILLAKTIVPILNFAIDLGVREAASLYYFSFFSVKASIITSATIFIWIFNLLLPIIIGSFMIWHLKISLKK